MFFRTYTCLDVLISLVSYDIILFPSGIVNYMKRQAGPSSTLLQSVEAIKKFSKSPTEARVVGFFSESTNSKILDAFMEAGNLLRMDTKLGHCMDAAVATEMEQRVDTVVVYYGT